MDRRRTPTQHTTEELLKGLENNESISEAEEIVIYPDMDNDIPAFLSTYQIEPGNDIVPENTLYELYSRWSNDPISWEKFLRQMAKYLLVHMKTGKRFYMINQTALKLSQAAYQFILERTIDKTKSQPWKKHFDAFIEKYQIKPGKYYLETYVLYDLYDEYVYTTKKKSYLGEDQFFNFCKIYFTSYKLTESRARLFGVDESIKQFITEERLTKLRENRVKNVKKQQKNKKK